MSTIPVDPERDLIIERVIAAPRRIVWHAWTNAQSFEQWWVPAPARSRVVDFDVRPGGSISTLISEDGGDFGPHFQGAFLAVEPEQRLVFGNSLVADWRPAAQPFITAEITFDDHPDGTLYRAHVLHKDAADRALHEELGFADGWGAVTAQLAALSESRFAEG